MSTTETSKQNLCSVILGDNPAILLMLLNSLQGSICRGIRSYKQSISYELCPSVKALKCRTWMRDPILSYIKLGNAAIGPINWRQVNIAKLLGMFNMEK